MKEPRYSEDVQRFIDWALERGRVQLEENSKPGDPPMPVALILCTEEPSTGETLKEPAIGLVTTPAFSTTKHKDEFVHTIQALALASNAIAVIFQAEAWGVQATSAEPDRVKELERIRDEGGSIKEHPDRYECLQQVVETKETGTWCRQFPFKRDEGKLEWLPPWPAVKVMPESRFANFILRHRMDLRGLMLALPQARRIARAFGMKPQSMRTAQA